MKSVSTTVSGLCLTSGTQTPIGKIELFETTFPGSGYGFNMVYWRNTVQSTGVVYAGTPITAGFNPLTNSGVLLAEKGQCWSFYGVERPLSILPQEPMVARYEGYFQQELNATSVTFKLIANPQAKLYLGNDAATYPSGLSTVHINQIASGNTDSLTSGVFTTGWSSLSWHSIRLDHIISGNSYAKVALLYKTNINTTYRLVDCSRVNTTGAWLVPISLTGVFRMEGSEDLERGARLDLRIAKNGIPGYDYNSTLGSFGVLRANRMLKAYAGFLAGTRYYVPMGTYFIDSVTLDKQPMIDILSVSCRDSRKKTNQTPNLLYPNILSYDVAGYNSDTVFSEPDGKQRYHAYDSWTLAEAVRDLLYQAGLTSEQLWATGADGTYKIQENSIRLNRTAVYRLKLPNNVKEGDLKYSFEPGRKLEDCIGDLVDQHNYEWGIDSLGHVFLREANNPNQYTAYDSSTSVSGTWSSSQQIDSFGGYHILGTGLITITPPINFVGYNIFFNRHTPASTLSVTFNGSAVSNWQAVPMTFPQDWYYRYGIYPASGVNPCVLEVGRNVASGTIKIYGTGIDFCGYELFTRDRDTANTSFGLDRVLRLSTQNTDENIRNDVVVAGDDTGIDLNNLVLSRSVDYKSIMTPAAKNYVGEKKTFILPDPSIIRQDLADFLSFAILNKYRKLVDIVDYEIPGCPILEVGDCIEIEDTGGGLDGELFWLDKLNWTLENKMFKTQVVLSPYRPFPSYQAIEPAANVSTNVTDFSISRTDGVSINPDFHSTNTLASYETPPAGTGYYTGRWAEENPPVYIKASFNLWKSSIATLTIKDLRTHKPVAIIFQDRYLEWGYQEFFWDGRFFNADQSDYTYFPIDPDWSVQEWDNYRGKIDTTKGDGTHFEFAGYFYAELYYRPVDDFQSRDVILATNSNSTDRSFAKVVIPNDDLGIPVLTVAHTMQATGASIPYGQRWEVYDDQYSQGPKGILTKLVMGSYPAKVRFKGSVDLHILLTTGLNFAVNDTHSVFQMAIQPEAFANGYHLYRVLDTGANPWSTELIAGETDFLDANATYYFHWDLTGLPLVQTGNIYQTIKFIDNRRPIITSPPNSLSPQNFSYRNGYLTQLSGFYTAKNVNVGWYFIPEVETVPKTGLVRSTSAHQSVRLEDRTYSGYKHCIFWISGEGAQLPRATLGGSRQVHFTCLNSGVNYKYD